MNNQPISNENDFKVVEFMNSTDFDFTPDMGCMYDSRPIFGMSGNAGIMTGERISLPFHIGNQLALNLAKQSLLRNAPPHDPKDINPVGKPLWNEESIDAMKASFLNVLYTNDKPVAMSETDKLMQQVNELNKFVRENIPALNQPASSANDPIVPGNSPAPTETVMYKDKAEVIAELTKRGLTFNARDSKAKLEQLLA